MEGDLFMFITIMLPLTTVALAGVDGCYGVQVGKCVHCTAMLSPFTLAGSNRSSNVASAPLATATSPPAPVTPAVGATVQPAMVGLRTPLYASANRRPTSCLNRGWIPPIKEGACDVIKTVGWMGRESTEKERTTMNTASNGERNQESKNNTKKKET